MHVHGSAVAVRSKMFLPCTPGAPHPRCAMLACRFGRAFAYLGPSTPIVEQRYIAAELDNPDCDYTARGFKYQGGALSALEKSFVQACIAKDPAQRWTAERLLGHPYLAQ